MNYVYWWYMQSVERPFGVSNGLMMLNAQWLILDIGGKNYSHWLVVARRGFTCGQPLVCPVPVNGVQSFTLSRSLSNSTPRDMMGWRSAMGDQRLFEMLAHKADLWVLCHLTCRLISQKIHLAESSNIWSERRSNKHALVNHQRPGSLMMILTLIPVTKWFTSHV